MRRVSDTCRAQILEHSDIQLGPRQVRHHRLLEVHQKVVKAAIPVSAIHPAFTLNRAVIEPGCSGGNSFKIGPALSLTPKGGAGVCSIGNQPRWSTMRIPLTSAPITSARLPRTPSMPSTS